MGHHHKDPEWCREGGGGEIELATNQWRKACLTKKYECVYQLFESLFKSMTALERPFEQPVQTLLLRQSTETRKTKIPR